MVETNEWFSRWEWCVVHCLETAEEVFKRFAPNLESWAIKWDCSFIDLPFEDWRSGLIEDADERFGCLDWFRTRFAVIVIVVVVVEDEINCWRAWIDCFCASCSFIVPNEDHAVHLARPTKSAKPGFDIEQTPFVDCLYKA